MQTGIIPYIALSPSRLCLGCGDIGGSLDHPAAFALLDAFVEAGGTFLDTAKVYCDWLPGERSVSEKTIAAWFKARGCRDQMVIATKGAHPDLSTMHIPRLSPQEIRADLEASLRQLAIETIDLYYLHRDDPTRPVGEILETLEAQVQAGKIRAYACSNWRPERIQQSNLYAQERGLQGFSANQPLWNFAKIEYANVADSTLAVMDDTLYALHAETGLACVPFSSQANGFFHKMENGRAEAMPWYHKKMYLTDENRARFDHLLQLKARTGLSTTQIILGYLLSQPFPVFPIVGPHTLDQLGDTLSAADITLTEEDVRLLTS